MTTPNTHPADKVTTLDPKTFNALVERIARVIDPSSWAVMDGYLEQTKRKYHGQNVSWPADQFQHKESMAKAREILAVPEISEALGERERIVAWLRRYAIGSGWARGKTPGAAWANGLNEAADAIERGDHLKGTDHAG